MSKEIFVERLSLGDTTYTYYSLDKISKHLHVSLDTMSLAHKIILENAVRHACEHDTYTASDFSCFQAGGAAREYADATVAYYPERVLMQDFTGVPALVDFAALRDQVAHQGKDPSIINPTCPVDLVIDHSVQVDSNGLSALDMNIQMEMQRNHERYRFLKWGQESFASFRVIPPGKGICHQVNLEFLADVVMCKEKKDEKLLCPDTLVGLDSHTTMVNGMAVLGWGVGGIEAESVMLGRPLDVLYPEVVGVKLMGKLPIGVTSTDLVLTLTQLFRRHGVVGKWLEFYGPGALALSVPERATIANMTPEFGATCSLFGLDENTLAYLRTTGRSDEHVDRVARYIRLQDMGLKYDMPEQAFASVIAFDLADVKPCVAGPKRPQDKVFLADLPSATNKALQEMVGEGVHTVPEKKDHHTRLLQDMQHADVVVAAITSCTNTSNPELLVTAGMLAQKAKAMGLSIKPWVKTSFAPGSRVVVQYLQALGLLEPLADLGFRVVGYGCTTCIGNSGPLPEAVSKQIEQKKLSVSAVLSGNRNFEGRIHPLTTMNWLASPPLVIAYALAGTTRINMDTDPLGYAQGNPVYLRDLWPTSELVTEACMVIQTSMYQQEYQAVTKGDAHWDALDVSASTLYPWQADSTYIQKPDFVEKRPGGYQPIRDAHILAVLGDAITTDHISPAGSIKPDSPAGLYLQSKGIAAKDFNSYGSRRGNHEVMLRGTFANIRIQNRMTPTKQGGYTLHVPSGEVMSIYEASMRYRVENTPLLIIAGNDYGSGSSRDWAAKGTYGLGVKAVVAQSFERIHRSNLIGMGVLPCQFVAGAEAFVFTGQERCSLLLQGAIRVASPAVLEVMRDGKVHRLDVVLRLDSQAELGLYLKGGVFSSVLTALNV